MDRKRSRSKSPSSKTAKRKLSPKRSPKRMSPNKNSPKQSPKVSPMQISPKSPVRRTARKAPFPTMSYEPQPKSQLQTLYENTLKYFMN
jgi:hypothetical protein